MSQSYRKAGAVMKPVRNGGKRVEQVTSGFVYVSGDCGTQLLNEE